MISRILESDDRFLVPLGLKSSSIEALLKSAAITDVLGNNVKLRLFCSTIKTRAVDPVVMGVGVDVCIGLKPIQCQQILDRPMCVEFHAGCGDGPLTWGTPPKPVVFLMFNSDRVSIEDVISQAGVRHKHFMRSV